MNIFVGNLSFTSTEADVKKLFEGSGNVASVVIVMRDKEKAPKSRGFGFVEMPREEEALAAISALNGKEFMGRVLDVSPTRPKTEAQRKSELQKKRQLKARPRVVQHPREQAEQKKVWVNPAFNKRGKYKSGRRSRSYMKRHGSTGV
ncbi:MAG: hypothetical protein COS99_03780 [Candidatus Omnitrophica bacterium CG07_land_8_20_14_0_80_42_15]|uniref:RRM domain-containing protein n=1 Tax=Candidatus Aquitaenariimonas noxiae TaxID=1974741 RepID=A0A2J0KZA3_9BACT|nr:MAG: hypothetical protein COS99_03780 [Candidatus Omnitrophica bacterium CG07_land_8_20_14_0_80_42_15]